MSQYSIGVKVGVEILDGNAASEVMVGGRRNGRTWAVPTITKEESMEELDRCVEV